MCLALLLTLTGCGGFMHSKEVAADAMDQFHERFNAGEYDKIYDLADGEFQAANTRTDFLKLMASVHRRLGDYKSCDNQDWSSNTFNGNTSVTLKYRTTFLEGTGDEEFVFGVAGNRATLRGYHINSSKLVPE